MVVLRGQQAAITEGLFDVWVFLASDKPMRGDPWGTTHFLETAGRVHKDGRPGREEGKADAGVFGAFALLQGPEAGDGALRLERGSLVQSLVPEPVPKVVEGWPRARERQALCAILQRGRSVSGVRCNPAMT